MPVARERDFRSSFIIQDVPLNRSASRVMLRLYALSDTPTTATVSAGGGAVNQTVTLMPLNGIAFATLDLGAAGAAGAERTAVSVNGPGKLWGVVTVTNNGTQSVTAVWPQ
jgi:hypothetical protein